MIESLFDFINRGVSCYHVTENTARILREAGFQRLYEQDHWMLRRGEKYYVIRNDASLAAFRVPESQYISGFMLGTGHCDSPSLKIRETAELSSAGKTVRLSVEPYGGGIWRSWLDRPLSLAGRVILREHPQEASENTGENLILRSRLVNIDRDLLMIPSVSIHMQREVNKGSAINPAADLLPLFSGEINTDGQSPGILRRFIAEYLDIAPEDILSTELYLYNRAPAVRIGYHKEFIAAPRLDDLQCVFSCLSGFLQAVKDEDAEASQNQNISQSIPVLCIFHNEEVGSGTMQGADSTFLSDILQRITTDIHLDYTRLLSNSFLVSADNAQAVHPAHPELYDPLERPVLNGGPVLKYNANQRYTTDAVSGAIFEEFCRRAGVKLQKYSNRADLPGGSTLGHISTSHVSVLSIDTGLPQLAMHSAMETAGAYDSEGLVKVMAVCFRSRLQGLPDGGMQIFT